MTEPKRVPIDFRRCQADKPNGNTFTSLGGQPGLVRCDGKPTTIIAEKDVDEEGVCGSMSLCDSCRSVFIDQCGDEDTMFIPIVDDNWKDQLIMKMCAVINGTVQYLNDGARFNKSNPFQQQKLLARVESLKKVVADTLVHLKEEGSNDASSD